MSYQSRHGRIFVSWAFAPLSLSLFETLPESPAVQLLLLTSLGATLLLCGVLNRLAKSFVPNVAKANGHSHPSQPDSSPPRSKPTLQGSDDRAKLVQRFLDQGRTAILLRPQIAKSLEAEHFTVVQQTFLQETALVTAGEVVLTDWTFEESEPTPSQMVKRRVEVEAFYLDRFAVTNRQFKEFMVDGGYGQQSLWDSAIWPRVNEFVDRAGTPGPRFWNNGTYANGDDELPVVGVNWYEADAFARWAGRRLPLDAEWVKAATCPNALLGQDTLPKKFPWGDNFDPQRANVWISGSGGPVNVDRFQADPAKREFVQLIGNVWEWTGCDTKISSYGRDVQFELPLKCLRGGAFDTYFENQTTCQLQSGDSPLARRRNVGFRCAISAIDVIDFGGEA
jgi:iron(II)-dependent oxidoreductase